jgi:hypothetical protein
MWFDPNLGLWKDFCAFKAATNYEYTALFVSPNEVLVTGKDVAQDTSTLLLDDQGNCTKLSRFLAPRCYHGLAADWRLKVVFAFGGSNGSNSQAGERMNSIEKLQLASGAWQSLEPMQSARSHFNPCSRYPEVYLAGGGSTAMEVFHLDTELCQPLPCVLPTDFIEVSSLSVIQGGLLVVLCRKHICKVKLSSMQLIQSLPHKPVLVLPRCQPLLRNQVLYTVDWYLVCKGINIETGEVISEVNCPDSKDLA